jgi:DNA-binding GntR family transcriptional regulator
MTESKTPSLDVKAYSGIKELMFGHRLSPGQKIIYKDLEKALDMSRTPIAKALVRLEEEGLVFSQKNCGYYVRELKTNEVEQMYDLREKMEEIAIDYAISVYQKDDILELNKALDEYLSYTAQFYDATRFKLDIAFHIQIAKMGRNEFLVRMLKSFYESAWTGLHIAFFSPLIEQFNQDHKEIYQAIKTKDRKKAKQIIRRHEQAAKIAAINALTKA